MDPRRTLTLTGEGFFVAVIVALVVGQALGQPVLLGYVETGSMAPTLQPGDGFVAVPAALTGDVEEGDVVVFEAQEIQGGGLTTHRVVGETDRGYVTRGDANPFTDQDGDEPPVKDAQIVAEALQVGGSVVVLPGLGTAVTAVGDGIGAVQRWFAVQFGVRSLLGTQGLAYGLLALSGVTYLADLLVGGDGSGRDRSRNRDRDGSVSTRLVLAGLAAVLVATATAAMVVPAGTQQFGVVSAEFDSDDPTVVPQGESSTVEYRVPNAGLVPVYVYLEPASEGVAVEPRRVRVPGRGEATATLTLSAPPETGYYRRYVAEHRYLAVLPPGVVQGLHVVHPWLPVVAIDVLLGAGLYGVGRAVVDDGRVRFRRRPSRPGQGRLQRLWRTLTR